MKLTAALIAMLAFPLAACASSIVYVKDYNVWITTPDGGVQRPVTTSGVEPAPYFSPSQADDGTIVAGWQTEIYRLNQRGEQVGPAVATVFSEKPGAITAAGPFRPRVSPDGRVVAYWLGFWAGSYDPTCDCIPTDTSEHTAYSYADGSGPLGFSRWWQSPSWIDATHVLLLAPGNRLAPQVGIGDIAALGSEHGWFNDDGQGYDGYWQDVDQGVVDRTGRKLALVRGMQQERISLYSVDGFDARPVLRCEFVQPTLRFADPTWAPDGRALAWAEGDGIWVAPVPDDMTMPESCGTMIPRLVAPGGIEPYWGPAEVSPEGTPAAPSPGPSPAPGPAGTCSILASLAGSDLCGPAPAEARFPARQRGRFLRAIALLERVCAGGPAGRMHRLTKTAARLLHGVQRKTHHLAAHGKIPAACSDGVDRVIDLLHF